jgi:hypothetical protein
LRDEMNDRDSNQLPHGKPNCRTVVRPICKVRRQALTRGDPHPRCRDGFLRNITVAPITGHALGIATEVPADPSHGLDNDSVISCDNIVTVDRDDTGEVVGFP